MLAGAPLLLTTAVVFAVLLATPDPSASLASGFRAAQVLFLLLFLGRDGFGASPGKRLFGLKAVRLDGRPANLIDSAVRNLPLLLPGWNLVELAAALKRGEGRRPGDRAAGTVVVEA